MCRHFTFFVLTRNCHILSANKLHVYGRNYVSLILELVTLRDCCCCGINHINRLSAALKWKTGGGWKNIKGNKMENRLGIVFVFIWKIRNKNKNSPLFLLLHCYSTINNNRLFLPRVFLPFV